MRENNSMVRKTIRKRNQDLALAKRLKARQKIHKRQQDAMRKFFIELKLEPRINELIMNLLEQDFCTSGCFNI
jgi:single-stranded DNA-specific DHH superfamily exonuclease